MSTQETTTIYLNYENKIAITVIGCCKLKIISSVNHQESKFMPEGKRLPQNQHVHIQPALVYSISALQPYLAPLWVRLLG